MDSKPQDSVTSFRAYTDGHYTSAVIEQDRKSKPVLYTANGQPLTYATRKIGFGAGNE